MNGKMRFETLMKEDHKFGDNQYVLGRISGMLYAICNDDYLCWGHCKNNAGYILITECTPERYEIFKEKVEEQYPDLCIFDYRESK